MRLPTLVRHGLLLAVLALPAAFGQPAFDSISSPGSSYPNQSAAFSAGYSDTAGNADILNAQVFVGPGSWPGSEFACNVGYNWYIDGSVGLLLVDSDGHTVLGPVPIGGSLNNNACSVTFNGSSHPTGTQLTVNFAATFTGNLLGDNGIWGYATSLTGSHGDWVSGGRYTVTPTNITISTTPSGLSVTVDGHAQTTPYTNQWAAGDTHTLAAADYQPAGTGSQYRLAGWSDQGADSHTITVPTAADTTYNATYATQYLLTTAASPGSGGTVSPPGVFYDSGSQLSITASPSRGYVFGTFLVNTVTYGANPL